MEEDFDKRLSDHIRAVFNDAGSGDAEAGWALLRQKYPPANKRKPLAWFWWLAAAMIISGAGFGLWQVEKKMGSDKTIKTVAKAHNDSARQHASPRRINTKTQSAGKTTASLINKATSAEAKTTPSKPATNNRSVSNNNINRVQTQHLKTGKFIQNHSIEIAGGDRDNVVSTGQASNPVAIVSTNNSSARQPVGTFNSTLLADGISIFVIEAPQPEPVVLPADQSEFKQTIDTPTRKKHRQLLVPGVFASAFYNSATGSDNEFNLAGGASLDLNLTPHWGFSTGLGIVRNTFNYTSYGNSALYGASSSIVVPLPSTDVSVAKMTAIDIPLNIHYTFGRRNYLSAGVSSLIYINQYYDQIHSTSSIASASSGLVQQHTITDKNWTGVDLFKTLNFSLGHGWTVSKNSVLIFEPFFKTTIGGQGLQNLRYSSAGLTLKFNFEPGAH